MVFVGVILATACLLQAAGSTVLPGFKTVLVNNVLVPKTKSDFSKNNISAKWALGYPKERGAEDFHYSFGTPDPGDNFNAVVTDDEKYVTLFNGTHVQFIDVARNFSALLFPFQSPANTFMSGLKVRPATQGGYDVLTGFNSRSANSIPTMTLRQRLDINLQPIGTSIIYQGSISAISKQGKMVSLEGDIYDLETASNSSVATLKGQSQLTDFSFSPDGVHLASVSSQAKTADLWNATSGDKIYAFPDTGAQNWLTRFSPDGKYVVIALGSANNSVQIYALGNLTAPPIEIKGFNDWPRNLDWSPTSRQIAISDNGRLRIFDVPSKEVVQDWEITLDGGYYYSPTDVKWLDNGKKLAWQWNYAKYMYDFEQNSEWVWTIRNTDHSWGHEGYYLLKEKGYAVTVDGDSTVRFWTI
ncbi:YVTN repeat-like/Quino protein amine dehydrogenase [Lophiostoma macrostomum CBS 122681]|uniref:YVTN repeat-like/Quino protein amine dehydrogenase n=1 Tax=Lophiostoma macrostomum CBS 122681 TaxID=1314788 RepID=A0A6A6TE73_9PLEO|nr:YVTN repeat-like/Quino protein amine dehydrogenase [Lophiostoma macrostomum CBS 122681]